MGTSEVGFADPGMKFGLDNRINKAKRGHPKNGHPLPTERHIPAR
jgi:hypothetical protein